MNKTIAVLIILVLAITTVAMAQTQHWYLLEGEDAYIICPTALDVEILAPNAVYLYCKDSEIYLPLMYLE